jgi:hypothetical protein
MPALARLLLLATAASSAAFAQAPACRAESTATRTPVIELYTSEGCSSCPPADRWISTLKGLAASGKVVAQAFHVAYWDYIGWIDRFATPAHTVRQREVASANRLGNIYTPQLVRDGRDWRDFSGAFPSSSEPAGAAIRLARSSADVVEAEVTPAAPGAWSAYWTVTEHGHSSKVNAGENSGELLRHDFVVRQYVPAGRYQGAQKLKLHPVAPTPGHAQQVNLVVFEPMTGKPLQALSLGCS